MTGSTPFGHRGADGAIIPGGPLRLSIVIPVYNEAENLRPLYVRLMGALDRLNTAHEVVWVDDGSTDGSREVLRALAAQDPRLRVVTLRRNVGKALALSAGFRRARGEVIITLDADLQDDPEEIPRFLTALEGGTDLVCGWRERRHDPWPKILLSRIYNWATRRVTGVPLHDFNCGFKAYRRSLLTRLRLYGDLHRYIPVLAAWRGYRIGELTVQHHARLHGQSKYGTARLLHGMLDLLTVLFLTRYDRRPLHLLGGTGTLMILAGLGIDLYLTGLWILGYRPIGNRPLLWLGILLVIVGVQCVFFGLLAEFLLHLHVRTEDHDLEEVIVSTEGEQ
jgi:glycosyltransferase involved in cell wall biosynthesis